MEPARRNLLVVACLLAAPAARADSLVATMSYERDWSVHRIADGKVKKLSAGKDAIAMAFSDSHTLWVLRSVKGKLIISRIDDGKAKVDRTLDLDGLKNAYEPVKGAGSLVAASDGSVWVVGCNPSDKAAGTMSCKRLYLRVDSDAFTVAKAHPKAIDSFAKRPDAIDKQPAGYSLRRPNTKKPVEYAVECHGPGGSRNAYGGSRQHVTASSWLSAKPAIARIDVSSEANCDGEDLIEGNCDAGAIFVSNCTDILDDVRALPDDTLAISKDSKTWQLYKNGRVIGTIPGGAELMVAP